MSNQNAIVDDEPDGKSEAYECAKRNAIALLDQGFRLGGVILATRDEWHDRKEVLLKLGPACLAANP